jgi:hypothetical protein
VAELDFDDWDPWRPEQVRDLLAGVEAPWYVAAGWAIDLFLGGQHREHEDIELAVPNDRVHEFAKVLTGFEVFVITGPGQAMPLERARDRLGDTHQTWVREHGGGPWLFDLFREPSAGATWICRRNETIRMPYADLIEWSPEGIPYGRPEVVLLFKAKHAAEAKNQLDFDATVPKLDAERRRWLAEALELVHPGHAWLEAL